MAVQFMQSDDFYSHPPYIGQSEVGYTRKQVGSEGIKGGKRREEPGYFKALLAGGHEGSACSSPYWCGNGEDSKTLLMRSLEIRNAYNNGRHDVAAANTAFVAKPVQAADPATNGANAIRNACYGTITTHISGHGASPTSSCSPQHTEPNQSGLSAATTMVINPFKRARESVHREGAGISTANKREKKEGKEHKKSKPVGTGKSSVQQAKGAPANGTSAHQNDGDTKAAKSVTTEAPPRTDYVHVRARRGQATDSHSLAERVRREKISERMKFLQDLVPGCSKITGKALILDEIINYVQSLQNQVEFLAMRLAATNVLTDYPSVNVSREEQTGSPFMEDMRGSFNMIQKATTLQTPSSHLQFDSIPGFCPTLFEDSAFNSSMMSDLSTSTCNDSNLTDMDFGQLA